MGKLLKWLAVKRQYVLAHLTEKQPFSKELSDEWWITVYALRVVNISSKIVYSYLKRFIQNDRTHIESRGAGL
jgi:hypothetical protein